MANKVLLITGIQLAFMNNYLYTQKRNADKIAHLGGYVYLLLCIVETISSLRDLIFFPRKLRIQCILRCIPNQRAIQLFKLMVSVSQFFKLKLTDSHSWFHYWLSI